MIDGRSRSYFFTTAMLAELEAEAARLDRPLSWVMQRAWKVARRKIRALATDAGDA